MLMNSGGITHINSEEYLGGKGFSIPTLFFGLILNVMESRSCKLNFLSFLTKITKEVVHNCD